MPGALSEVIHLIRDMAWVEPYLHTATYGAVRPSHACKLRHIPTKQVVNGLLVLVVEGADGQPREVVTGETICGLATSTDGQPHEEPALG